MHALLIQSYFPSELSSLIVSLGFYTATDINPHAETSQHPFPPSNLSIQCLFEVEAKSRHSLLFNNVNCTPLFTPSSPTRLPSCSIIQSSDKRADVNFPDIGMVKPGCTTICRTLGGNFALNNAGLTSSPVIASANSAAKAVALDKPEIRKLVSSGHTTSRPPSWNNP